MERMRVLRSQETLPEGVQVPQGLDCDVQEAVIRAVVITETLPCHLWSSVLSVGRQLTTSQACQKLRLRRAAQAASPTHLGELGWEAKGMTE